MPTGYDIWGVVSGVLGLLGFIPLLYGILQSQLPHAQLKALDEALAETTSLFHTACEEGLLKNPDYVAETEEALFLMSDQTEQFRSAVYCATTFFTQVSQLYRGLSRKIALLCKGVKKMRANISATSEEERERLLQEYVNSSVSRSETYGYDARLTPALFHPQVEDVSSNFERSMQETERRISAKGRHKNLTSVTSSSPRTRLAGSVSRNHRYRSSSRLSASTHCASRSKPSSYRSTALRRNLSKFRFPYRPSHLTKACSVVGQYPMLCTTIHRYNGCARSQISSGRHLRDPHRSYRSGRIGRYRSHRSHTLKSRKSAKTKNICQLYLHDVMADDFDSSWIDVESFSMD